MPDSIEALWRFLEMGGPVLWLIGLTAAMTSALIIERYWYLRFEFPQRTVRDLSYRQRRGDRFPQSALRQREVLIAGVGARLNSTLPLIGILVALCPMLGLLGTVTGMMGVFDTIVLRGTGDARAMSSGISRATIPTMAGMLVAIPGLYFKVGLQRDIKRRVEQFADRLSVS